MGLPQLLLLLLLAAGHQGRESEPRPVLLLLRRLRLQQQQQLPHRLLCRQPLVRAVSPAVWRVKLAVVADPCVVCVCSLSATAVGAVFEGHSKSVVACAWSPASDVLASW